MYRPKIDAVLSPDERWRRARALAQAMTPASRMEGRPTIRPQVAKGAQRQGIGTFICESVLAFAFFVTLIFIMYSWFDLIFYLTH